MTAHTYQHRFKNGTIATLTLNDNPPQFTVEWSQEPTRAVLPEYFRWRKTVVDDFQAQTGKRVLCIDLR